MAKKFPANILVKIQSREYSEATMYVGPYKVGSEKEVKLILDQVTNDQTKAIEYALVKSNHKVYWA